MKAITLLLIVAAAALADGPGIISSYYSKHDFALTANPKAGHWKSAKPVYIEKGPKGDPLPRYTTSVRSRWTDQNLYFLFVCPYEELYLHPNPSTTTEMNKLWEWDVAEVFVGTDFDNIHAYKEFEISPQGEWVDLDINLQHPNPDGGVHWNSGFEVKARIDPIKKIWYGELKIPIDKIDSRKPQNFREMRINFYRTEGPPTNHKSMTWQPTGSNSFHVPEAFGRLVMRQ